MQERKDREQKIEYLSGKIMTENFPNLVKEIDIQVQEAQRVPNKMNPKRPTPRHIIIEMQKDKERIFFSCISTFILYTYNYSKKMTINKM